MKYKKRLENRVLELGKQGKELADVALRNGQDLLLYEARLSKALEALYEIS